MFSLQPNLSTKFIIIIIIVFLIGASISWHQIRELQYEKTKEELVFDSRLVLETMIAVRQYTSENINLHLKPLQGSVSQQLKFIKETAPSYAANTVFDILQRNPEYSDFEYKEAALNPTNHQDNKADVFEQSLIEKFARNWTLSELSGPRLRDGKEYFYTARPIVIESESCLVCHSSPDIAPSSLLATYGYDNGFGWEIGEVVAVRMVYVPGERVALSSHRNALVIAGMLIPVFIALALAILLLIRRTVVTPVNYLRSATSILGNNSDQAKGSTLIQYQDSLHTILNRNDEIGSLAKDFASMASVVINREAKLEEKNTELERSKRFLQSVMDNATASIITTSNTGIILSCNPSTEHIFGYSHDELTGKHIKTLIPEEHIKEYTDYLFHFLNSNLNNSEDINNEFYAVTKSGNIISTEIAINEIRIDNQHIYVGFIRDITQHKLQLQREHEASIEKAKIEAESLAKSSFLANMSHEIRTPLAAIIGYAESIIDNNSTMESRLNAVNTIIRNGNYLLHIINEILDLSKIESSNFEINVSSESIFSIIDDVRSLIKIQAISKDIDLVIDYQFPIPEFIDTDSLRLKQILINLCNNAIKFTDTGSVTIRIYFKKDALYIAIIDTGPGLTKEQQEKIFNEYVQADYLTYNKHGGTGLGLPISKKLANKLGGDITLQSKVGKGSEFTISLPVSTGSYYDLIDSFPVPENSHTDKPYKSPKTMKLNGHILIAEDNEDIADLVGIYLTNAGVQYTHVTNGEEAVKISRKQDFDLILMDMQMPIMNGVEAVRQIKSNENTPPIIMLTANAMTEDRQSCIDAGCNNFLTKPLDRSLFIATLSNYLEENITPAQPESIIIEQMEDGMQHIIQRFVDSLPHQIQSIKAELAKDNWDELKSIFHQLKGLAGGLGFPQVSELAAQTEFQVTQRNRLEIKQAIETLEHLYKGIIHELRL